MNLLPPSPHTEKSYSSSGTIFQGWSTQYRDMGSWLRILKRSSDKHKCINCDLVPCMNLYREVDSNESGELYLYESTVKNKVHLPCEFGVLIQCLCRLLVPISGALSFDMYNQCIRDLKAVSLLVFTGHYRNAMQIMRPVIENFLTGLYWDMKLLQSGDDEEALQTVFDEYDIFTAQDRYVVPEEDRNEAFGSDDKRMKKYLDQEFLMAWLLAKEVLDGKGKAELQDRIGILNRFLHPSFKATDVSRPECASCPSCVSFDEKEYRKCIEIFQDTTTLLLATFQEYIVAFSPEDLDDPDVKEALGTIRDLHELEAEIGRQLVFSRQLKEFIVSLANDR